MSWLARRARQLRVAVLLAALRALGGLSQRVPRPAVERLCRLAGDAWYLLTPSARSAVRANLRQVLGYAPSPALVRSVYQHGALNYWDTFALARLRPEQLDALVRIRGWENLDAALAAGRGAIMVSAHLGSVALAGQAVAARGYPIAVLVEPVDPPELFDYLSHLRGAFGARMVPVGPSGVRELLTTLRGNGVAGLITDRDVLGTGIPLVFFGAPTTFPDGAAALALRTGAPILMAVAIRGPDGIFHGVIEPALPVPHTGSKTGDVRALTEAVARSLEYHIGQHPEQWTVFQPRWSAPSHDSPDRT